MDLSIPNDLTSHTAYSNYYEQYVIDASFLWVLRSIALHQPHYYSEDILDLEKRIDAQIDGLMTSPELGWSVCEQALELEEPGEVFTAMLIAMRSYDTTKIQKAVEVGIASELAMPGLISALGWLPENLANTWVQKFLSSKDLRHKTLGLAACSVRRLDPGEFLTKILQREDCQQEEKLYARALRLVGELRRQDCMPLLQSPFKHDSDLIRFWSHWSATLLGDRHTSQVIKDFVLIPGSYQALAIDMAFRILPVEKAREWISIMAQDEGQVRAVIKATGVLGDPHAVNWLIGKMNDPSLAKLAGESFSLISGIDLESQQLSMEEPQEYPTMPNDDAADDGVDLDEDENLPYPNLEKITALWQSHGRNFVIGRRYFMGKPITAEILQHTLVHGTQRQRHAAAMELALNENDAPLVNTRARIMSV